MYLIVIISVVTAASLAQLYVSSSSGSSQTTKTLMYLIVIISVVTAASLARNTDTCNCDCNSKSVSMYEQLCCESANRGMAIKILEGERRKYVICPNEFPYICQNISKSCSAIQSRKLSASSGYYNILLSNGSITSVYCDMEGTYCDGEGGWTRVAYLNMTEPGAVCPEGLVQKSFNELPHDLCGKEIPQSSCSSTQYDSYFIPYTKVCGQVKGYQFGHTDGLFNPSATIDDYVSGISITYSKGQERKHIWTYASGENEADTQVDDCPCNSGSTVVVPSFVGTDYYCESGFPFDMQSLSTDALWDGENCNNFEAPCCTDTKLPWFYRRLNESTSSDIEVRVCGNDNSGEDVPVDIIEVFVK